MPATEWVIGILTFGFCIVGIVAACQPAGSVVRRRCRRIAGDGTGTANEKKNL